MVSLQAASTFVPQHPRVDALHPRTLGSGSLHPRTLIADDDADILTALRLLLKSDGYEPETASSPAAVLEAIERAEFDVVLIDLNYARDTTSGREGIDLISRIQALDPSLPIVVMTAWATVDLAVEAMRRGVRDFVQKPWENPRLLQTLRKQVRHARARRTALHRLADHRKTDAQLQRELIEARELQENLLTSSQCANAWSNTDLQVAIKWQPATTVGGDYVAAFNIDDEHAALCVADVVGKSLPAALLMANFQASLKSFASQQLSPAEVSTRLNDVLYANIPLHKFVTAFYGVVNIPERKLTFTNAGHNPPLLVRRDGECIRLEAGGTVLGAFPNGRFEQGEVELRPDDRLVLFTDGLTEAVNASGEQFGEDRLIQTLSEHRHETAENLKENLFNVAAEFCGNTFCDDAALMVVAID